MAKKESNFEVARTQINESLDPESVKDWKTFTVHKTKFRIKPMSFGWEKKFRRFAMPYVASGLHPLEMMLVAAAGGQLQFQKDLGISLEVAKSECDIDHYITPALSVVCASQAEAVAKDELKENGVETQEDYWQKKIEDDLGRQEIIELVEAQLDVIKAMDHLGNSLSRRFKGLSGLLGKDLNLSSLMPSSTIPAGRTSEKDGSSGSTVSRSSGTSTEGHTQST